MPSRPYRAGQSIEDYCRACRVDRIHTIVVVDADQQPLRVTCDYCGSEHKHRGGGRTAIAGAGAGVGTGAGASIGAGDTSPSSRRAAPPASTPSASPVSSSAPPLPLVTERETSEPVVMSETAPATLEALLRRVIREEGGLTPTAPAEKWRGGDLVLRPGRPGVQEKTWPIETFFHKVVMLRNRLRTLEQQVNAADLPEDQKLKLQAYITGCYGSLTSFNILFADDADRFVGSGD
jgi:hypothetical protein